jgi:hypothetical protein
VVFGCSLLQPYPGGGDPADAFTKSGGGLENGEDPLLDPPTDDSVSVVARSDYEPAVTVALPGTGFPIRLAFTAPNRNVVGGGIRLPGSDEVQWTFTSGVQDQNAGDIDFTYLLPMNACEDVSNLCYDIVTEQFAVAQQTDGSYAVSEPVEVIVVLQCATCTSLSCLETLPPGVCKECTQPDACKQLYDVCYAPGAPSAGTDTAKLFDIFLGENGILWSGAEGCFQGDGLCQAVLDSGGCDL